MARSIESGLIRMSIKEVVMHAGHEVLVEVGDTIALIVDTSRGILGQQLRPQQIQSLNIILIILYTTNNSSHQRWKMKFRV